MKKLLSLLLALVILAVSMASASAATLAGRGMQLTITEDANGLITGVATLEGPINAASGYTVQLAFDNTKVIPLKADKTTTITTAVANTGIASIDVLKEYFDLPAVTTSWAKTTSQVRLSSPYFIQFGVATSLGSDFISLNSGVPLVVARFYFKKIDGETISDSTFTFQGTGTTIVESATINSGTDSGAYFKIDVVPYEAKDPDAVEDKVLPTFDVLDTDATATITFSGTIADIANTVIEAGVEINGVKLPAGAVGGGILRSGKFAVQVYGFDSLPTGPTGNVFVIKTYQTVNGATTYDNATGYTFSN